MHTRRLMMGQKQGFTAHLFGGNNGALGIAVYNYILNAAKDSDGYGLYDWYPTDNDNIFITVSDNSQTITKLRVTHGWYDSSIPEELSLYIDGISEWWNILLDSDGYLYATYDY